MVNGARDGFVIAAGWTADEQRVVGRRGFGDIASKALSGGALTQEHAVRAVQGLSEQLLCNRQLVLQLFIALVKLLLELANRQVCADPGEHFLRLKRLVDEIDGAQLETVHFVAGLRQRRQEDDRRFMSASARFQTSARLEPVHARHHDIQHDEVWNHTLRD